MLLKQALRSPADSFRCVVGGAEGVEGEGVGLIADGVEADLEAGGGAVGGEVVEVGLRVAGDAAVLGVVGVRGGEGGGVGAEGAIHEALELREMEERIVGGVAGALLLEGREGEGEVEPLGDAEGEFPLALEVFEDEEVVEGGGVVLDAGDTVGEGVVDGGEQGRLAFGGCGRRDLAFDEARGGGFSDDAGEGSGGVVVQLAAGWVGRGRGDAGGGQGE